MPRPATGAPTGRPPRTSRADILGAARTIVEGEGWERLTIRRLATAIGTSPATIYYHVRDKDDLFVQLLGDYAEEIPRPELPDDPRERIVLAATLMHDGLAERPWITEVITADDLLGDAALWLVETMIAGAVDDGLDPDDAVRLYRHVWYYTAGELLIRARRTRRMRELDRPAYREEAYARLDADEYPQLARVSDRWASVTSEETWAQGLDALLDGLLPPSSP